MRLSSPGLLVAIEGIDGAGKTTQAQLLQKTLWSREIKAVRTKEPTVGQWGQLLRDSAQAGRLSPEEEVETFILDRQEHVRDVIVPALTQGAIVIMDRYYFSNAAYQGARGLDPETILRRNEEFAPEPDLLVLLEIAPEFGLERIKTRGDRANLFETNSALARAREIFQAIQRPYLSRVNGVKTLEETRTTILAALERALTEKIATAGEEDGAKLSDTLRLLKSGRA